MNFSVTELETLERCKRKWRLTSRNGMHLGPIVSPLALSVGTLIHEGSQAWLLNPDVNYREHVTIAGSHMIAKAEARYKAQLGVEMSEGEMTILMESVYFARIMAENYQIRWGSPLPEGFTLIRPEQRAVIPVPGTEHPCENSETRTHESCLYCDGTGWALHKLDMRFDGLIQDRAGRIHVLEHKTFKSHPNVNSLRNSHQFLAYLWGVRQLNMGPVGGLAYDGLWRRDKVPPRREFNDLFLRYTHTRSDAEFEEFGRLLTYQMNEAYALRPEHRPLDTLPFDRRWQGCFDCSFDDSKDGQPGVCSAMSRAEHGLVNVLLNSKFTVRTDDTVDEDETEDAA